MHWLLPAALPSLFWLWLFRRHDHREPEPLLWVLFCFVSGALVVIPALPIENMLYLVALDLRPASIPDGTALAELWGLFVPVVVVEELVKFLAFLVPLCFCRHLDEPLDGIIYGGAAGLGFAAAENYLYMLGNPGRELSILVMRSSTAVLLHAATTAVLAMAFAKARLGFPHPLGRLLLWFGVVLVFHTGYDVVALHSTGEAARGGMILLGVVLLGIVFVLSRRIRRGQEHSRFFHP
jgi:RsiW-degrading membrane proteinase PrsW (M82 family)